MKPSTNASRTADSAGPASDPSPSSEDLVLTERLRQAGEMIGIRILDHVVIGHGGYVSLAEQERW